MEECVETLLQGVFDKIVEPKPAVPAEPEVDVVAEQFEVINRSLRLKYSASTFDLFSDMYLEVQALLNPRDPASENPTSDSPDAASVGPVPDVWNMSVAGM